MYDVCEKCGELKGEFSEHICMKSNRLAIRCEHCGGTGKIRSIGHPGGQEIAPPTKCAVCIDGFNQIAFVRDIDELRQARDELQDAIEAHGDPDKRETEIVELRAGLDRAEREINKMALKIREMLSLLRRREV